MESRPELGRRLIGLDVGERRIGVAVSDELGLIASPVESVDLKRDGLAAVRALIEQYDPERVIIGLPTSLSGREGPQAASVRAFAREFESTIGRPVVLWDERLTTAMAERALIEAGHRRQRRKERIDAVAAALILQSYLDARPR